MTKPKCIRCGRRKAVVQAGPDLWKCTKCGALFDNEPEEGGDFSTFNPAARMEREDRTRKRRQNGRI